MMVGRQEANIVVRNVRARFSGGVLEPLDDLDLEEGAEVLLTLEEQPQGSVEAEDAALARAIDEGLATEAVNRQQVMAILRDRNGP